MNHIVTHHEMLPAAWSSDYALRWNLGAWGWPTSGSSASTKAFPFQHGSSIEEAHLGVVWMPGTYEGTYAATGCGARLLIQQPSGLQYDMVGGPLWGQPKPGVHPEGIWLTDEFQELVEQRRGGIFGVQTIGRMTLMTCTLMLVWKIDSPTP